MNGYPNGNFEPARSVLDIESLKMILNAKNFELDPNFSTTKFNHLDKTQWYYPFLVTGEKHNLIENLNPGTNYKKADVAEVIFRAIVIGLTGANSYSSEEAAKVLSPEGESSPVQEAAKYEDYSAQKRSVYQGVKPFAIFFHASWCPICRAIEEELKANLESYPDDLLILEADYDTETELKQEFGVTRQYWFVIFDAQGNITFSNNLFNAEDVVEEISKTL